MREWSTSEVGAIISPTMHDDKSSFHICQPRRAVSIDNANPLLPHYELVIIAVLQ
jgi:hypothetical protein